MHVINKKNFLLLLCFVIVMLFSGCTDWKKKYNNLNVEHQNTLGLLQRAQQEKGLLANQLTEGQQTIEELQRQIEEMNKTPGAVTGFGDELDVSVNAAAGTITVTLDTAILFDSGKADLKRKTELDHIASVLKSKYASREVGVVGHTDNDPIKKSDWDDNWELSSQRALTVARYLISKGLDPSLISAVGCGEYRPVASNSSSTGKAQNRRVEIVVHMR